MFVWVHTDCSGMLAARLELERCAVPLSLRLHCLLGLMLLAGLSSSVQAAMRFSYTLDNRYQTSAGVYDADKRLLRTLWGNETREAGPYESEWDGLDDDGKAIPTGTAITIKLIAHNITYRWEGVIGNTADKQVSPVKHDYQYFMRDFALTADRAYVINESEGVVPRVRWYELDHMNGDWSPRPGLINLRGGFNYLNHIAVDDERVYVSRRAWTTIPNAPDAWAAFVVVLSKDLDREILFPEHGEPACATSQGNYKTLRDCYGDGRTSALFSSVLDKVNQFSDEQAWKNDVTGLAVQQAGPWLLIAHGHLDSLHVVNKTSGKLEHEITIAGIGELALCTGQQGSSQLWAIYRDGKSGKRVAGRFAIDPATGNVASKPSLTIDQLKSPLGLSLDSSCSEVVVADGGEAQQLKAYSTQTGKPLWEYGKAGGYGRHGADVSADKLSFFHSFEADGAVREHGFVVHAQDGGLWVSDTGVSRLLKLSAKHDIAEIAAFLPINYNVSVDLTRPERVFSKLAEYRVDYSKTGPESWQLLANYGLTLKPEQMHKYTGFTTAGFSDVATLSNGRTYGLLPAGGSSQQDVVELLSGKGIRFTKVSLPGAQQLRPNGDLSYVKPGKVGNYQIEFGMRRLQGFDTDGDPVWSPSTTEARVNRGEGDPTISQGGDSLRPHGRFDNGVYVGFDPRKAGPIRFRLAAAVPGDTQWLWRASPSVGAFNLRSPDGRFDNTDLWYAGNSISVAGNTLVYNFHGESWSDGLVPPGQANQFLHFHDSGLFLGQFGTPTIFSIPPGVAGLAGNSFSHRLITTPDGELRFFHSDEHAHAGIHRWWLDGIQHIREWQASAHAGDPGLVLAAIAPAKSEPFAPAELAAKVQKDACAIRLEWSDPTRNATGYEIDKELVTWPRPEFRTVASVAAGTTAWTDKAVEPGVPQRYRVRAVSGSKRSAWSNIQTVEPPAHERLVYTQDFSDPHWSGPKPPEGSCYGLGPAPLACGVRGGDSADRYFTVTYPASALTRRVWRTWRAPELLSEFNTALSRPLGSAVRHYRVEFDFQLLDSDGSAPWGFEVGPSASHLLSLSGGRIQLTEGQSLANRPGWRRIKSVLSAIPNGRGAHGLGNYWVNTVDRFELGLALMPMPEAGAGSHEARIDRIRISRLECP